MDSPLTAEARNGANHRLKISGFSSVLSISRAPDQIFSGEEDVVISVSLSTKLFTAFTSLLRNANSFLHMQSILFKNRHRRYCHRDHCDVPTHTPPAPAHQTLTFLNKTRTSPRFSISCSAFSGLRGFVFNSNTQSWKAELPFSYSPVVHTYKSLLDPSLTSERAPLCEVLLCTIAPTLKRRNKGRTRTGADATSTHRVLCVCD